MTNQGVHSHQSPKSYTLLDKDSSHCVHCATTKAGPSFSFPLFAFSEFFLN